MNTKLVRTLEIDLLQSREKGRETDLGLIVLGQTADGRNLGETILQVWTWDDLQRMTIPRPFFEGALDNRALVALSDAALKMAGL